MEPRTSSPKARLETVSELSQAGIPVGVLLAPIVPGLTDHEIPNLLKAAKKAGAMHANSILLRLPGAVESIFLDWVEEKFPLKRSKIESRIRSLRQGKLSDNRAGSRLRGKGIWAEQHKKLFELHAKKYGLTTKPPKLNLSAFADPEGSQGKLF